MSTSAQSHPAHDRHTRAAKRAVIKSYAKINLFLDVVCKRPDGYHNIETIFQSISLCDVIDLELVPSGISLTCDNPSVPTGESNLALKAFSKLREAVGYDEGVRIGIRKIIPPGSGLGGGSSNAAAALVGLNQLMQGGLSMERLHDMAREIGADVPFFLSGGLAAAWQIGDRLTPLPPLPASHIVVVVPRNLEVSTAGIYGILDAPECAGSDPEEFHECSDGLRARAGALAPPARFSEAATADAVLYNALEAPVMSRYPEIGEIKNMLLGAGARGALMSGSGSAVFGLADSLDHAAKIKGALEKSASCACFVAQTTDRGRQWEDEGKTC